MELKRIKVWSAVKVLTILGLILGVIFGILMYLLIPKMTEAQLSTNSQLTTALQQSGMTSDQYMELIKSSSVGLLWAVPVFAVITSFLSSLIFVLLYNLVARFVGGIKLEFKESEAKKK